MSSNNKTEHYGNALELSNRTIINEAHLLNMFVLQKEPAKIKAKIADIKKYLSELQKHMDEVLVE